jgi:1-deoxy-D-xylulose-5-phosphate synthase
MVEGSALSAIQARFPDRVYDVGIAEQHAVTFSAGLATGGMRPVCLLYSTFLQRAIDQIVHDVCIPGLPVVFAIDRAGLVGADGATHQGAYDIALLRPFPSMAQWAPVTGDDLSPLLQAALKRDGPTSLRFPRGTVPKVPSGFASLRPGRARWLRQVENADRVLVTLGPLGLAALEAAQTHPRWAVLDAGAVAPLDVESLREAAQVGEWWVVEEGTPKGGLGSALLEWVAEERLPVHVTQLALPHRFIRHGDARVQRAELGLDAAGIARAVSKLEHA